MNLFVNVIIDVTALVIVTMMLINGVHEASKDISNKFFNKMLVCNIFYICADILGWCLDGRFFAGDKIILPLINAFIYVPQIIFAYLWLIYTDFSLNESREKLHRLRFIYLCPMIIEILLIIINIFTGWIFYIDNNNVYVRGKYFLLFMLLFYCYAFYTLFITIKSFFKTKDKEKRTRCLWLLGFMFLPYTASLILALYVSGISLTAPFFAISLLMIYLNVHRKRLEEEQLKVALKDIEIQKANVSIMLSQIQPHFLYNSLSVIEALCEIDSSAAARAMNDFAFFLRGNMDSLTINKPISFEQELIHTKRYLALEKIRFGDFINIEYDIQTELFRIPTLTLQPIVENAVRYGVTKREEGGTVKISTFETDSHYVIKVDDDGVGYDVMQKKDDGRTHIGISNVRTRLEEMCGGTLDIKSVAGVGTNAVITIPKTKE